jgi:hypothetical protein
MGHQSLYHLPSSFFWFRFFFLVNIYAQTPGTCLHHTFLLVGVTDPGNSGVFIFESWDYMGIDTFSNAHNFVKNLLWTSFYISFLWLLSWPVVCTNFQGLETNTVLLLTLLIKTTVYRKPMKYTKFSTYYNLVPRYVQCTRAWQRV